MKKPQHPSMLVYEDNHVIEWGTKNEIRLLVKSANEAQIAEAKEKGTWKELSDIYSHHRAEPFLPSIFPLEEKQFFQKAHLQSVD